MPVQSKPQSDISITSLNPMVFYGRFPHISEKIFKNLNIESLKFCREVSKLWVECIDHQDILWNKIVENTEDGNIDFQVACLRGRTKIVKVLIQKSSELNIDFNWKKCYGKSAFLHAIYIIEYHCRINI